MLSVFFSFSNEFIKRGTKTGFLLKEQNMVLKDGLSMATTL